MTGRLTPLLALMFAGLARPAPASTPEPPWVIANDNRQPAGRCAEGRCVIELEVIEGRWHPEEDGGPYVDVPAIAEVGRAPSVPGPLLRAPEGWVFDVTVHNRLADSTIWVHGLVTRPSDDSGPFPLDPGETGRVRIRTGEPGTYLYWIKVGSHPDTSDIELEQLAGAIVVDSTAVGPDDRVFVINIWGRPAPERGPDAWDEVLAINGRSFPFTEPLEVALGDTVHWRWVNASRRAHPMHLHGFFFRMDAHGSALVDTAFAPDRRWLAVTETLRDRETMALTWAPTREGNWLFHCHLIFHASPALRMPRSGGHDGHNAESHMAGLVMGIRVPPGGSTPDSVARRERLYVQRAPHEAGAHPVMSYVLEGGAPPAPDSVEVPGSPLILTRGELTAVTVLNRLPEPTGVHWHGLELESYSDGVPDWSGVGDRVAPRIMPGDSFTARLTMPKAGTFIYHSHLNDVAQLTAGLFAPLIVVEPDEPYDPATDHTFTFGWAGDPADPALTLNGSTAPAPMTLSAGVTHRFRFINIAPAGECQFSLWRDSSQMTWQRIAKDGADLPPALAVSGPASLGLWNGETVDVLWTPPGPGRYELHMGPDLVVVQPLIVRD